MAPVDRTNPKRADSSESRWSLMDFLRDFPNDETCLDWLWRTGFAPDGHTAECPKCERPRRFHRIGNRPSYDCDSCGYHIHPTAGTIFHKSSTSLHLWFYAMHLMTSTRCGISAKQLERELGVNYKTAWRMMNLIRRELMGDDGEALGGHVEADATYIGGRRRGRNAGRPGADSHKRPVFGMVLRKGHVAATVAPDAKAGTLTGRIEQRVLPLRIPQALQGYRNEYVWRYDTRQGPRSQFETLLLRAARS